MVIRSDDVGVAPAVYERKRRPSRRVQAELLSGQVSLFEGHPEATGFRRSEAEPETDRGAGDLLSRFLPKSFAPLVPDRPGCRKIAVERVVKPCHCKCSFCEHCGGRLGRKLRSKLVERLRNFKSVFGITLTVDPELFPSPEAAYLYVMSKYGRVGKLVKKLYKRGYLRSRHYFVVIEWQQNGWPHWHVLVDSSFIPFGVIVELWSANRPKWAPKIRKCTAENYQEFDRPAFGSVRFSFRDGGVAEDAIAAAWYAAGYLVKVPEYGFPEWVLHYRGNIKRFSHSQGFFKRAGKCEQPCFCPECLERLESGTEFVEELPQRNPIPEQSNPTLSAVDGRKRLPRTIADRIRDCRSRSVIMEREIWRDEQGADFVGAVRFVQGLNLSYENVLKCFNAEFERPHEIVLTDEWEEHRLRVEAGLPGLEIWEPF